MKSTKSLSVFFFLLISSLFLQLNAQAPYEKVYKAAIADAENPTPSEIYQGLTAVDKNNKELVWKTINGENYVLVVSWKKEASWYSNNKNGFYPTERYIWVTMVPQVKDFCSAYKADATTPLNLRLKQLIGLMPNADGQYMMEFWVRPQDLFRPCPDNEITDQSCDLCLPGDVAPWYREWFNDLRAGQYAYVDSPYVGYPWTQLGYTYDWNPHNITHIGMSEFVIKKGVNIVVHKAYTTKEYCSAK